LAVSLHEELKNTTKMFLEINPKTSEHRKKSRGGGGGFFLSFFSFDFLSRFWLFLCTRNSKTPQNIFRNKTQKSQNIAKKGR
jgi:hypothetical protein